MNSGRQAGKKTPGLLGQARGPFKEDESCADRLRLGIPAMASQSQSSAGRDPVRAAVSDSGLEASALISVPALPLPTAQCGLLWEPRESSSSCLASTLNPWEYPLIHRNYNPDPREQGQEKVLSSSRYTVERKIRKHEAIEQEKIFEIIQFNQLFLCQDGVYIFKIYE
ncbi:plasminogen receptor (KT) isoform X2 [Delphinapterus leucas]|uniref:Plasminogen receptor (KT) isoform X2 n=1 Tax=Delphinapterus leucas TaxID=9749 RepID=A0A2Y9NJ87_DELLE|nr:plasminogen receptor (KT) isoform X2 [Delphinapterus leucas]